MTLCICGREFQRIALHIPRCKAHKEQLKARCETFLADARKKSGEVSGFVQKINAKIRKKTTQSVTSERRDIRAALERLALDESESCPSVSTQEPLCRSESHGNDDLDSHDLSGLHAQEPASGAQQEPIMLPPTRSGRVRHAPRAYTDFVPTVARRDVWSEPLSRLVPPPPPPPPPPQSFLQDTPVDETTPEETLDPYDSRFWFRTKPNAFGIYRRYPTKPLRDPDDDLCADDFTDSPNITPLTCGTRGRRPGLEFRNAARCWSRLVMTKTGEKAAVAWFWPLSNVTSFRIIFWRNTGSIYKSQGETARLFEDIIRPGFKLEDLLMFSITREEQALNKALLDPEALTSDGWVRESITIPLPCTGFVYENESIAPRLEIEDVYHRDPVAVIDEMATSSAVFYHQFVPYETWHIKPDGSEERVVSESYEGDKYIRAHIDIQPSTPNPDDPPGVPVEYVVLAVGGYSDSTHLTQFSNASLWPAYWYFLSLSKYIRTKPGNYAAQHMAYIPSLPDNIQDAYLKVFEQAASDDVLRLCKSEVFHKVVLAILYTKAVQKAMKQGRLVHCADKVWRRFFLRLLWYAADYPEKMLAACLRFIAECICPRDLTPKADILWLGTKRDERNRARLRVDAPRIHKAIEVSRRFIYENGTPVKSAYVERILKPTSLVPNRSGLSVALHEHGTNFYQLFVVDLMHEIELGVWKDSLKHILRILHALGGDRVQELNNRFRQMKPFGNGVIRTFGKNVTKLTKMAARSYENILQCILPCLERLIRAENIVKGLQRVINNLVWDLLFFHALAKLREQTETTIRLMRWAVRALGISQLLQ